MSDGGKGSKPRPYSVSQAEYDTRWDAIFSRDLKDESNGKVSLDNQETQEVKDKDNNK
jgi:hypothetical protein